VKNGDPVSVYVDVTGCIRRGEDPNLIVKDKLVFIGNGISKVVKKEKRK